MSDPLDCIDPELFAQETPEQHTARVLAEIDRLLREGIIGFVSVETDADNMFRADCPELTTGPHQTYIGALSALIEAHRAIDP